MMDLFLDYISEINFGQKNLSISRFESLITITDTLEPWRFTAQVVALNEYKCDIVVSKMHPKLYNVLLRATKKYLSIVRLPGQGSIVIRYVGGENG